ncbi:type II toxin-antitoxin system RelE family toxin [Pseudanabaena sp. PCC 6802]|uniref:type II toxin-antitoxin system RelE family toxin n=1 Tax=Pseudanabaena sp. PCC 6802 TaxID=118173 RepID=UPI0003458238|nr:type II toxin-antitoxin system RelE/ParE family toxin [Pseudanabaena sp. PCC 6802]
MSYSVTILRRAQKELANLPTDIYPKVQDALRSLADEPRPSGCLKLKGREEWRIRVGDYRVLYAIDDIAVFRSERVGGLGALPPRREGRAVLGVPR